MLLVPLSIFCCVMCVYVTSYNLLCPANSVWNMKAKAVCNITEKYFCLYNNVEDRYIEDCKGPDWDRKGSKRIYAGSFTRGPCNKERYQPFTFWTNGSSHCAYRKSLCNGEGQVVYRNGSSKTNRWCRCDFTSGYAFVVTPSNGCYCDASLSEDCSCCLKNCTEGYTLSADYECVTNKSKPTKCEGMRTQITRYKPDVQSSLSNKSYVNTTKEALNLDSYRQNKLCALISVAILLGLMIGCSILAILCRHPINRYIALCKKRIVQPLEKHIRNTFMGMTCRRKTDNGDEYDADRSFFATTAQNFRSNNEIISEITGPIKIEEVYTLRLVHLIFRVAAPILRIKFDKRIPPEKLKSLLNKCFRELQRKKKRNDISPSEWNTLFSRNKEDNVTSDLFDIKIMVILLKALLHKNVTSTQNDDADWNLIRKYQQDFIKDSNMEFTFEAFNESWDKISEAILSLAVEALPHIKANTSNQENAELIERISSLNVVPIRSELFCKTIKLSHEYPAKIFQQIIKEYCVFRRISFPSLISDEKHDLYHRRKRTLSCCTCKASSCPVFVQAIYEKDWRKLFDVTSSNCCKDENTEKKCVNIFKYKSTLTLETCDASLATCLILNIPDLSKYTFKRMCVNGIGNFLNRHKHRLYHGMVPNKCCQCDSEPVFVDKISKEEWDKLYTKIKCCSECCQVGCASKCFDNDSCDNSECCCKYTARWKPSGIRKGHIISKILNMVGPIRAIKDGIDQNDLFDRFCNGDFDDDYLHQKCKSLRLDLNNLLNLTRDEAFKTALRQEIRTSVIEVDNTGVKTLIHAWASSLLNDRTDQTSNTSTSLLPILINEQGGLRIYKVYSRKEFKYSRNRSLRQVSQEEMNFLRMYHFILKVACPAVRKKFDEVFPPDKMKDIILDWSNPYTRDDKKYKSKKKTLYLNEQQMEILNSPSSEHFDIEFMGYLLMEKRITEMKMLQELLENCHNILHSCDGILSDESFEDYWRHISEKSIRIGGEEFTATCFELKQITNIPNL